MSKDIEAVEAAQPEATGALPVASQLIEADPYLVAFSLDNPRKRRGLDIDSLNALAASIKAQGLAQPILVRPLPGSRTEDTFASREEGRPLPAYELVCGERRLRASRIAELPTIPMLVRELDDQAALELQLVENIEREDLDPMEEAEGFALLRDKLGYSVDQIAERIGRGKGRSYVYKTMKLLDLTPESREAMYDGHLGRSTGLLVARYPAAQQAAVVEFIKSLANNGEPASYRFVAPRVHTQFNLVLTQAVWDLNDALLVQAAGACSTCPKRTGAANDLFAGDEGQAESCTDAACFAGKRQAYVDRAVANAKKEGLQVIEGDEARKAIPSTFARYIMDYDRLDAVATTEVGDDGVERELTFGDLLRAKGKKAPKPMVLISPHTGEAIKVIPDALADQLVAEADARKPKRTRSAGTVDDDEDEPQDDRPEDQQALDDHHVRRATVLRIFDAVRNRDRTDAEVLLMAKAIFSLSDWELPNTSLYMNWSDDLEDVAYGELEGVVVGKLDALPAAEVAAVATMAAIETVANTLGSDHQVLLGLAGAYGIDVLAVRDKVAEDLAAQNGTGRPATDDDADDPENSIESPEAGLLSNLATDDPDTSMAGDEIEAEAQVGSRVRMKDDLRSAGGKRRKISGREGVLLSHVQDDEWMVKCDGSKEKTRVHRDEFEVLGVLAGDAEGSDGVETRDWPLPESTSPAPKINPLAAWPFPRKT